jgi:hypothetical protein
VSGKIVVPKLGFSAARLPCYHVALNIGFRVVCFLGYFVESVPGSARFLPEQARSEEQLRSHACGFLRLTAQTRVQPIRFPLAQPDLHTLTGSASQRMKTRSRSEKESSQNGCGCERDYQQNITRR